MRVGELISWLNEFNNDMDVVIQASNSMYVDDIFSVEQTEMRAFWGEDREVCVITSDGQAGAV